MDHGSSYPFSRRSVRILTSLPQQEFVISHHLNQPILPLVCGKPEISPHEGFSNLPLITINNKSPCSVWMIYMQEWRLGNSSDSEAGGTCDNPLLHNEYPNSGNSMSALVLSFSRRSMVVFWGVASSSGTVWKSKMKLVWYKSDTGNSDQIKTVLTYRRAT